MNAKQLAAASVLVLARAASAQTVPAEAWVGPAIATTGIASSRDTVTAEMRRFMSMPQAAQDAWVGASGDTVIAVGAAKRSEVLADLKLFDRAGLVAYQASEAFDPYSAESRRRTAYYQRLRNGSEFAREVARVEGSARSASVNAQAADAHAD
jgi:hypothetical protein